MNGFKNLQAIPRSTYWFSYMSFDVTLHALLCVLLYIFQRLIMPVELYSYHEQLLIIFTVFFYGLSYLPILYCMTSAFRSISTLSTYLLFMLIVSGTHTCFANVMCNKIKCIRFLLHSYNSTYNIKQLADHATL